MGKHKVTDRHAYLKAGLDLTIDDCHVMVSGCDLLVFTIEELLEWNVNGWVELVPVWDNYDLPAFGKLAREFPNKLIGVLLEEYYREGIDNQ